MLQIGRVFPVFIIILISFISFRISAQDCGFSLKGLVEDSHGELLIGATIWIESLKTGTATNTDGTFSIDLCRGQYTILVKYVGYEDERLSVRIPGNKTVIVKMKPSVKVLHDIVIEGDHLKKHGQSQSLSILSEEQLLTTRGKPLGEILKQIPGVSSIMSGPAIFKPVINGLHSQRILILNNGVRQEGQQWGVEHAPEIDTYIASELEVIKGAEAVRYGSDAMGGVIIINTLPLHYSSSLGGEINLATSSNNRMGVLSGMLEGGLRKHSSFGWRVQTTLKKGGDYHSPDYNLSNTGLEEFDFSVTSGYRKNGTELELYLSTFNSSIGILRSAHTGNLTDLQNSIVNQQPWYIRDFTYEINNPRQVIGHHLLKLKARKIVGERGALNFQYAFQYNRRKEFDIRRDRQNIPSLSLNLYTHTADASMDFGKNYWAGSVGMNWTLKYNDNLTSLGMLPDYVQLNGGVFVLEKYKKDRWLFEAGIRYDKQMLQPAMIYKNELLKPTFHFNYISASAGGAFSMNPALRLSSNLGFTSRPPHVSELYSQGLHHGTASIEEGLMIAGTEIYSDDDRIEKENSFKWINTLQIQRKSFSAELSAYVNYFRNYIFLSPTQTRLTIRGYFPVFKYRQTNALLVGSDFSMEVTLARNLIYTGKASYIVADDRTNGNKLPFIPPFEFGNGIVYNITSAGKWKDINLGVTVNSTLKQRRAPRTIYPAEASSIDTQEVYDFIPPPDAYTLVGLNLGANLPLRNKDLAVSIGVDNLFNKAYRNYMNRLKYYSDEIGRNFMFRVNYKFHSHHL